MNTRRMPISDHPKPEEQKKVEEELGGIQEESLTRSFTRER